jgi:uncharacterized membrane protein
MNLKHIGFALIFAALLVGITVAALKTSYDAQTNMIIERNNGSCFVSEQNQTELTCLHDPSRLVPFLGGGLLALTLAAFGVYLIIISKYHQKNEEAAPAINDDTKKSRIKDLSPDEALIFNKVVEAQGTIFQSELAQKSGFTKVKVTRILDKLEGKGLIDRRRRGMTNVVILKN